MRGRVFGLSNYSVAIEFTKSKKFRLIHNFGAIIGTLLRGRKLALPSFYGANLLSAPELRARIADRVRLERRRTKLTQKDFAEKCGIPLRTFKRFEQGQCDSLEAFLRIVVAFERVVGLELLFPPKQAVVIEVRSPAAALERLQNRLAGRTSRK